MLLEQLTKAYAQAIAPFPKTKHKLTGLYKVNHSFGAADILMEIEHLSLTAVISAVLMYDTRTPLPTDPLTIKYIELAEMIFISRNLKCTKAEREIFKVVASNACITENRLNGVDIRLYDILEAFLEGEVK